jgi:hypothetical protein
MFNDASPFPWLVEGNVLYRIDKVEGGTEKKTEIARFRVFQIQGKSKLKGVSIEEAHDNAALVAHAMKLYMKMEEFLTDVFNDATTEAGGKLVSKEAKKLRDEFYAHEDVSQE